MQTTLGAWRLTTLAGAAVIALCVSPSPSHATSFSAVCLVTPGTSDCLPGPSLIAGLTQGESFRLDLFMDGAIDVGDYSIDGITWPTATLSLVSIVDGGFLGACASEPCFQYDDSVAGIINFISFFDVGAPHSVTRLGKLAVLTFLPLLSGSVDIVFTGSAFVTDLETLDTLFAQTQGATLDITPSSSAVPEPATLLLLGSGVAGALARGVAFRKRGSGRQR